MRRASAAGPGIELLEYRAPLDGRPFPAGEHSNDVVHRHTILLTRSAGTAANELYKSKVTFVSSGLVANQTGQMGFNKAR